MVKGTGDAPRAAPGLPELRVTVTPTTAALVAAALLGALAAWNIVVAARSVLATAVAATVVAMLLSAPIGRLERRMPRAVAIPIVLLVVAMGVAAVAYVVYDDLDTAFARLQREAPEAAASLEESERFGEVATDLRLEERVQDAVDRLRSSAQDRAQATAFRFANYFLAGILAIFLLVYGPRMFQGGLKQIADDDRRTTVESIAARAFSEGRVYLALQIANATVVGLVAAVVFHAIGLPGASALALLIGLGSVIPDVGVVVGSVPALLLTAAAERYETFVLLCVGVVAAQAADSWFAHRPLARRLDVGPAVTLLAVLVGFAVYGVGGALFGVALAVFASALIDAVGAERDAVAAALSVGAGQEAGSPE